MKEKVEEQLERIIKLKVECDSICYFTRDSKFHERYIAKLRKATNETRQLKIECIKIHDEELSNLLLSIECFINALSNELEMWLSLKKDKPSDGWIFLISSQDYAAASIRAAHINAFNQQEYMEKLNLIEKVVFPPQSFQSPEWLVKSSKCSICRREYHDCDHIAGKAYMGEFCSEEVDSVDILSVAMVDKPWDKRRRAVSLIYNDMERDTMTWRVSRISKEQHEKLYGSHDNRNNRTR